MTKLLHANITDRAWRAYYNTYNAIRQSDLNKVKNLLHLYGLTPGDDCQF